MDYFAVSDIHGQSKAFYQVLRNWNADQEQLVLLGDYIDRGPNSLDVLKRVESLIRNYGAIALKGNHEDGFLIWLFDNEDDSFYSYTETIVSLLEDSRVTPGNLEALYTPNQIKERIKKRHPTYIKMMNQLQLYHETKNYIFAHAGFNTALKDFKNSSELDFMYGRNQFIYSKNETGKTIVFGHTNTCLLHECEYDGIWYDEWNTKLGIDGGAGSYRTLNGVYLPENANISSIKTHQIEIKDKGAVIYAK